MLKLDGPLQQYILGAFPEYSANEILHKNFKGLDEFALRFILNKEGLMTSSGAPTRKAASEGFIAVIENKPYWNLKAIESKLEALGNNFERAAVNQEIKTPSTGDPKWVNLGTLATYFSVSAPTIGKWLTELGLRDEENMATPMAIEEGYATIVEMKTGQGKNQTRKINHWDLYLTQKILVDNGHYLDFDYTKSLKGTGKNSDVTVVSVDDKAKEFARKFIQLYKDPVDYKKLPSLVKNQPRIVLEKAELLLKRPGFITSGKYSENFHRR